MKLKWWIGGSLVGWLGVSLVQAALPKRVTPAAPPRTDSPSNGVLSEIQSPRVTGPDLESDFGKLRGAEGRFVESREQQKRIKTATQTVPTSRRLPRSRQ